MKHFLAILIGFIFFKKTHGTSLQKYDFTKKLNILFAAQFCDGTETFEKITGVTLTSASETPLYSSVGNTVTAECNNRY